MLLMLQQKLSTNVWCKVEGTIFYIYIYIYTNFCNKFILLLQKDVYLYKYMNDWEKVDKTSLPKKNNFKIT